jgi:hypothetical protein
MFMVLVVAAIFGAMFLSGCGSDKLKGTLEANRPPKIIWSNAPLPDSIFRSNAVLSWFGKDDDGRVVAYYYYIALQDSVGDDPQAYLSQLPEMSVWHRTDSTVAVVPLFAPQNELDTFPQYIFVRCQDDDSAYSNILYRRFSRINHIPTISITSTPDSGGAYIWCLPDTTSLWNGLQFTWEGKDSIDFPAAGPQPDLDYEWSLYGPYDTAQAVVDTLQLRDTTQTLLLLSSSDTLSQSTWVKDKERKFLDLRTGLYLFVVRAKDDANTTSPSAWHKFRCAEPVWISNSGETEDILLVQATQFNTSATPPRGYPPRNNPANFPDSIVAFYFQMVQNAGYYIAICDTARTGTSAAPAPPIPILARYRLVIVDNMDIHKADLNSVSSTRALYNSMRSYLAIGGKVWVIGRQVFCNQSTLDPNRSRDSFSNGILAGQFFNLSGANYDGIRVDTAEFIGASPNTPAFENLQINIPRCAYMRQYGISKVESLERAGGIVNLSTTLFTYKAINPDTSQFNGLPVAVAYIPENNLFRTSYFSFPLYLMDNSNGEVQHVFDVMLAWFLNDEPL